METMRKLFISRSFAEISPMLWYEHWLWVSFGAEFEKRCWGASCLWAGTGTHVQKGQGRAGRKSLMHSMLWCCSIPFFSQLQVPCKHQRPGETRTSGTGIASEWGCWGACAGSPCQNCCTPGAAKQSQSSFVFWPMPSWTVDLELRRSAKLCLFENLHWSLFYLLVVKCGTGAFSPSQGTGRH